MSKLINITDPEHRCPSGDCPAVYRSEDGKTLTIIGKSGDPRNLPEGVGVGDHEEIIEISAEIVHSSLGVTELIDAAERADELLHDLVYHIPLYLTREIDKDEFISSIIGLLDNPDQAETFRALRSALNSIKGGDNA